MAAYVLDLFRLKKATIEAEVGRCSMSERTETACPLLSAPASAPVSASTSTTTQVETTQQGKPEQSIRTTSTFTGRYQFTGGTIIKHKSTSQCFVFDQSTRQANDNDKLSVQCGLKLHQLLIPHQSTHLLQFSHQVSRLLRVCHDFDPLHPAIAPPPPRPVDVNQGAVKGRPGLYKVARELMGINSLLSIENGGILSRHCDDSFFVR